MTTDQLFRIHRVHPFSPFDMFLADGRTVRVSHPENLSFSGPGRICIVHDETGTPEIIDLLLVVSLKPAKANNPRRGNVN